MSNNGCGKVTKENFCFLFNEAVNKAVTPQIIASAFSKAGIFPFNPDLVDYSKLTKKNTANSSQMNELATSHLSLFESFIDEEKMTDFKKNEKNGTWTGAVEDISPFETWKKLKFACNNSGAIQKEANTSLAAVTDNEPIST